MKPSHIIIGLVIIIQSCEDNKAKVEYGVQMDSLPAPKIDSTILIEQNKAIGEIKFGISEKQFDKEKEVFDKKNEVPAWEGSTAKTHKIGAYEYTWLNGYFNNDNLYKIMFQGGFIKYDDYDRDMSTPYYALLNMLKTKYGSPSIDRGLPSWTQIDKDYFQRCAEWTIGNRTIELRIHCHGTYYSLDLVSFKPEVEMRLQLIEDEKKKALQEKGTKAL
ncbi:MAG: hypothetical protein ABIN24_08810 [Dyadobacter sp.]